MELSNLLKEMIKNSLHNINIPQKRVLEKEIEKVRNQLHKMIEENIDTEFVVKTSQSLDRLIVKYTEL
jgi:uncharacterized membrane-anchored protein YhcB (DUF1043 family)